MPTAAGIYYSDHGGGGRGNHVIVLLHGAGGTNAHWPHQLRRLADWRVLAPDLPGHGRSRAESPDSIEGYAEKLAAWLEGLATVPAVLAGHSMGGAIALALAAARPELLHALVLIGCAAQLPVNPRLLDRLALPGHLQPVAHSIAEWSFSERANPQMRSKFYGQLLNCPRELLYADFAACNTFDVRQQIATLRIPALVLSGSEDRMVSPASSRALAAGLPRSSFQRVEGAGHMVMLEKPIIVQAAIQEFLMQL